MTADRSHEAVSTTIRDASLSTTISSDLGAAAVDVDAAWLDIAALPDRYDGARVLGEGGMGEVRLYRDRRIGRDVAMKVIRHGHGSTGGFKARFLREARVQGQLEHPAIVPVYDIGVNESGQAFFTMKRVRGLTLEEILDAIRNGDQAITQQYSRRKLLSAFGSVCLALEFAHRRGVVHRDLKPGNIMLGDFGEVYLLDWGIAKLVGSEEPESDGVVPVHTGDPTHTVEGELMGTPGFMSPEQVRGNVSEVDHRSDVYALGAILFELLTLEPLHERASAAAMLAATLRPVEARPTVRAPVAEVPPELDAICVRATIFEAKERFQSVREISDAIERYLDGDRDLERRRALSREQSDAASHALTATDDEASARRDAMQALGRALALDPENTDALRTLVQLVTQPPKKIPDEAREAIAASRGRAQKLGARNAAIAYLSWLVYLPFVIWMGVRNWSAGLLAGGLWVFAGIASFAASRRPMMRGAVPWITLLASALAVAGTTGFFGPLFLLPCIAAVNALSFVAATDRPRRIAATAIGILAIVAPFALELLGILPPSYRFEHGVMIVQPHIVAFQRVPTLTFLLFANVTVVLSACLFLIRFGEEVDRSDERLQVQAWQLRQLMPDEARGAIPSEPPRASLPHACAPGSAWAWVHKRHQRA